MYYRARSHRAVVTEFAPNVSDSHSTRHSNTTTAVTTRKSAQENWDTSREKQLSKVSQTIYVVNGPTRRKDSYSDSKARRCSSMRQKEASSEGDVERVGQCTSFVRSLMIKVEDLEEQIIADSKEREALKATVVSLQKQVHALSVQLQGQSFSAQPSFVGTPLSMSRSCPACDTDLSLFDKDVVIDLPDVSEVATIQYPQILPNNFLLREHKDNKRRGGNSSNSNSSSSRTSSPGSLCDKVRLFITEQPSEKDESCIAMNNPDDSKNNLLSCASIENLSPHLPVVPVRADVGARGVRGYRFPVAMASCSPDMFGSPSPKPHADPRPIPIMKRTPRVDRGGE